MPVLRISLTDYAQIGYDLSPGVLYHAHLSMRGRGQAAREQVGGIQPEYTIYPLRFPLLCFYGFHRFD